MKKFKLVVGFMILIPVALIILPVMLPVMVIVWLVSECVGEAWNKINGE